MALQLLDLLLHGVQLLLHRQDVADRGGLGQDAQVLLAAVLQRGQARLQVDVLARDIGGRGRDVGRLAEGLGACEHGREVGHRHLERDAGRGGTAAGRARLRLRAGHETAVRPGETGQLRDRPAQVAVADGQGQRSGLLDLGGLAHRVVRQRRRRALCAPRRASSPECGRPPKGLAVCAVPPLEDPGALAAGVGAWRGTVTFARGGAAVMAGWVGLRTAATIAPARTRATTTPAATESDAVATRRTGEAPPATHGKAVGPVALAAGPGVVRSVPRDGRGGVPGGPGHDVVGARRGDLEGRPGAGEEGREAVVVEHGHGPVSSVRGASPAPARALRAGSAARRRRASCRRDFTVPGRRPMASAMSRSLRSA